jgi:hypothetical protein
MLFVIGEGSQALHKFAVGSVAVAVAPHQSPHIQFTINSQLAHSRP